MIDVPVEVKDALREGTYKKNYRFVVLNEDGTPDEQVGTIDNNYLVSESVSIDERMCSGDTLKFGLCEGSSLEFQYFDKPNITGKRVQAFVDVLYELSKWQKKAVLESVFLENYECLEDGLYKVFISAEEASKISYAQRKHGSTVGRKDFVLFSDGHKECEIECNEGDKLYIIPYSYANTGQGEIFLYNSEKWHSIPMGFFDVKKCSRQASTGIIKATCYNKLQSEYLDAKANEQIIEIASQGEAGNDDVSFFYILRQLLEDYSIETYNMTNEWPDITDAMLNNDDLFLNYWMPWHGASVHEVCIPVYSTNSLYGYLHIAYVGMAMGAVQGTPEGTSSYYDRFLFALSAANYIKQTIYAGLGNTILDSRYVRNHDDTSITMSLREYLLEGGFLNFWASGSYTFDAQKRAVGGRIVEQTASTYITTLLADYLTDINYISIDSNVDLALPYKAVITNDTTSIATNADFMACFRQMHQAVGWVYKYFELELPTLALQRITEAQAEALSDVTLRDLQTSVYESVCQFGQLSRTTDLFSGVELNHSRLYPADTLYPATDLYPDGAAVSGFKSMYSKLWADEGNIHKWRYLIITYKGLNEDQQEEDFTLQRTVNNDGTDDYNMSDNWLFRNLVWTSEQVAEYAAAMVAKMQDMTWFPFEMWCAGLPYLETGDEIEIPLNGESYTSYVLQRQLKGIQNLQDTYINGTLDIF